MCQQRVGQARWQVKEVPFVIRQPLCLQAEGLQAAASEMLPSLADLACWLQQEFLAKFGLLATTSCCVC